MDFRIYLLFFFMCLKKEKRNEARLFRTGNRELSRCRLLNSSISTKNPSRQEKPTDVFAAHFICGVVWTSLCLFFFFYSFYLFTLVGWTSWGRWKWLFITHGGSIQWHRYPPVHGCTRTWRSEALRGVQLCLNQPAVTDGEQYYLLG